LVDACVDHLVRGLEDLLGAVAVVYVPVEDQDALGAGGKRVSGRDGDVVEQAEAHRPVALGVVPGWTKPAEGRVRFPCKQPVGRVARPACRTQGGLPRAR
jgi:hypothetical protein